MPEETPRRAADLEMAIDYHFRDASLLNQALTHRSFVNENTGRVTQDNQRLEFLGDAVVGLLLSREIFDRFPLSKEGDLSKIRASLVDEAGLALIANRIGLGDHLLLGRGEERTGGRGKPSILADAFEALMAAIYLDGGLDAVTALVKTQFAPLLEHHDPMVRRDFKTELQELAHQLKKAAPRYLLQRVSGPDHQRVFSVAVFSGDEVLGEGTGKTKKEAEQVAAQQGFWALKKGAGA